MRALKITNSITRRDEKSIEKYLAEISRYELLSPEEETRLFQRLRAGDEAVLNRIVQANLRFVVSVAKQYQNLGLWLGDLINEGNIGLIKAARRFDETKGFKFISYAVWWIRQSILQAVNEKARKIRLPLNQSGKTRKIMTAWTGILQRKERAPSVAELAEATGFKPGEIEKCLETYKMCKSLDEPVQDESQTTLVALMADTNEPAPDHRLSTIESQQKEVRDLLSGLNPRQATVISMYYGIGRKHPVSLGEIADSVGVSRERIRQIRDRGLAKLRYRIQRGQVQAGY
jgi:RNA polymerase primary sigma factor